MRHRKAVLKLSRTSSHRKAMFRNMVTSLFKHERIRTTDAKAKELRRWADNLITLAKRGDLHARRQALSIVREKGVVHKLFEEASERFGYISGGYTRVVKVGRRAGDAAPLSVIELIKFEKPKKKTRRKKTKTPVEDKKVSKSKEATDTKEAPPKKEKKSDIKDKEDVTAKKATTDKKPKTAAKKKTEPVKAEVQKTTPEKAGTATRKTKPAEEATQEKSMKQTAAKTEKKSETKKTEAAETQDTAVKAEEPAGRKNKDSKFEK